MLMLSNVNLFHFKTMHHLCVMFVYPGKCTETCGCNMTKSSEFKGAWIRFVKLSIVLFFFLYILYLPFSLLSWPQDLTNAVTVWVRRRSGVHLHLQLRSSLSEIDPTRWTRSPPCLSSGTSTRTWPGRWRWAVCSRVVCSVHEWCSFLFWLCLYVR